MAHLKSGEQGQGGLGDRDGSVADAVHPSVTDPVSGVRRGLRNRHLSMMALAGMSVVHTSKYQKI